MRGRGETEKALIIGILFLVALRFVLALYYPVFSDACMYFYQAKHIATDPSLLIAPNIWYFPPLLFIIGAFMHTLLGEVGLMLIAPTFGAIGIYYTYKLGCELFDEKRGLLATLFLGVIPSHIYLSSMGYMDSMVTGLSIAFVYHFHHAVKSNSNKRAVAVGVLAGLTALSKFTGLVVFPFIVMYFVLSLMMPLGRGLGLQNMLATLKDNLKNIKMPMQLFKTSLYVSLIGAVVCSPYYMRNWLLFGDPLWGGGGTIHPSGGFGAEVTSYTLPAQTMVAYRPSSTIIDFLKEVYLTFWGIPQGRFDTISFIPSYVMLGFLGLTILISLVFVYGAYKEFKEKRSLPIWAWILTWFIAVLILQRQLLWGFRRLLPTAPFLALFAGYGLNDIFEKLDKTRIKKGICVLLILAVVGCSASQVGKAWYANDYFDKHSDSLQYLKTLPDEVIVLTPYGEQTIYYAEKKPMPLASLDLAAFNLTTLKKYNITHIVRTETYLWQDLSAHNNIIDKMAEEGQLKLVWQSEYVKIYDVDCNQESPFT